MRLYHGFVPPALTVVAFLAQPANAAVTVDPGPFAAVAVSDEALAMERAGYGSPGLTAQGVRSVIDDQARSVERSAATAVGTSMDIWWESIGAQMIAANVRATAPGQ